MGVFLSKPCTAKFSEDGEDEAVGFGVSSMQGWRRNMEDAHVALLEVENNGVQEKEGGECKIRMFGVFDGHGGKEVALFVQEHLAEELTRLEEYKEGDFGKALARSFHRMDELLEGAATELRRTDDGKGQGEASEHAASSSGGQHKGMSPTSCEEEDIKGREGDAALRGTVSEGSPLSTGGATTATSADERSKAIMLELLEFRSRKNPSDVEADPPSSHGSAAPVLDNAAMMSVLGLGDDSDSDEENGDEVAKDSKAGAGATGTNGDSNDGDVIDLGEGRNGTVAAKPGSRGDNKIKMVDALELFHRILDIRKDTRKAAMADDIGTDDSGASSAAGAPGASASAEEAGGAQRSSGTGGDRDDEGEDTFGDSESEEEDVILTAKGETGTKPRMGLGASLASLVHPAEGPTCNLEEHPIQAGCTSVVCLMAGNMLHVANAGDSRAVLCRGASAVELSLDHKPMADTERSRIERAGGFVNAAGRVNGNLNLSRSIGDLKYKASSDLPPAEQMITAEPDIRSIEVVDRDKFVILACDGVWDCMTSQECVDFVGARVGHMPLSKICEQVMDACLSEDPRRTTGIGGDNMTCIVVLLDKSFIGEGVSQDEQIGGPSTGNATSASEEGTRSAAL